MGPIICKLRSKNSNDDSWECSILTPKKQPIVTMATKTSARMWCFTLNNPTEQEISHFKNLECNYIVFGKEHFDGAEGTTPHLQGCIRFSKTYRLAGLKKNISDRAHWEPSKDFEASVNYCMKEDPEPFIKDNRKQGQRTDLDLACETVKKSGVFGLARDDPAMFVKYHGGFAKLDTMFQTKRSTKPEVIWIYGDTGTGKTRQVHDNETSLFVAHASHQWWDGYRQQDAILIDDMRASWAPFNILLKILDRYQMQVQIKGGFVELNSPRIYITSQFPPHEIYNRENRSGEDIAQLLRRLGKIICLRNSTSNGLVVTSTLTTEEILRIDKEAQSNRFAPQFVPPPESPFRPFGGTPHSRRAFVPIMQRTTTPTRSAHRLLPEGHGTDGTPVLEPLDLTRSSTFRGTPLRPIRPPTPAPFEPGVSNTEPVLPPHELP